MPDLYITSLPLGDHKTKFVEAVTTVFTDALGCDKTDVKMWLIEVPGENHAIGGKLCSRFDSVTNGGGGSEAERRKTPHLFQVDVRWYDGKTPEMHDAVSKKLTEVVTDIYPKLDPKAVSITFVPLNRDNTYEGGVRIDRPQKKYTLGIDIKGI